ncbi:MAG: siderophore ABC transporter substrate-binding protein [Streptococcaceae bacterium]|jgi:iron complex transport system substrate-binding protein|nr:siderophore ABC transporter substrate-binding protein [Streptococcaceae bacterium]
MTFKKLFTTLTGVLLLATLLVACGTQKENTTTSSSKAKTTQKLAKTIEVTDSNGQKITVPTHPSKVVVFDNGSLDTIEALGQGQSVVGAATSNLPDYLKAFKKVDNAGGLKEPDLEKINALQPELIIISGRQESFKADLEKIAPVLYLSTDANKVWQSTQKNVLTLASIYGQASKAKTQLASLTKKINALKKKAEASNLTTLTVMSNEGQLSAFGPGSRYGIINQTFGFKSVDDKIEATTHGQSVSFEYVLEKNPDLIFVIDRTKAIGGASDGTPLADNDLIKQTTAAKNGKVIELNPAVWYLSGGGLESTQLMLEEVEKALN